MDTIEILIDKIRSNPSSFIADLIANPPKENLFIEVKSKRDASKADLEEVDLKNLSKCLSGFGNSAGGVIIWGIGEDKREGRYEERPITESRQFVTCLERAIGDVVVPPVEGVQNFAVDEKFVITFVPKSYSAPHRALKADNYYYKRHGEQFKPADHYDLEYMFGVRKAPVLYLDWRIKGHGSSSGGAQPPQYYFNLNLYLKNNGRDIARFPCVRLYIPRVESRRYKRESDQREFIIREGPEFDREDNHDIWTMRGDANIVVHPTDSLKVFTFSFSQHEGQMETPHCHELKLKYDLLAQNAKEKLGSELLISPDEVSSIISDYARKSPHNR